MTKNKEEAKITNIPTVQTKEPENVPPIKEVELNLADPPMKAKGLRLNIGCGDDYKEGFINIDPFEKVADAPWFANSIPLKDKCAGQIIAYEVLEHIGYHQVPEAIKEWHRLLVPRGTLHIVVPDVVELAKKIIDDPENEWNMAIMYGSQWHEGQYHKSGYTPKKLFKLFGYAGFRQIGMAKFTYGDTPSIYVEAEK